MTVRPMYGAGWRETTTRNRPWEPSLALRVRIWRAVALACAVCLLLAACAAVTNSIDLHSTPELESK